MTKFQNPMTKEIQRTKSQCPKRAAITFGVWNLDILWTLELGTWNFRFGGVLVGEQAVSKAAGWGSNPHAVAFVAASSLLRDEPCSFRIERFVKRSSACSERLITRERDGHIALRV